MVLVWCSLTYLYYLSKFMSDWSLFRTTSHVPRHQSHLDCIIRIYISDYPCIFSHFPHVQDSIMIRFLMSVSDFFKFPKLPIFLSDFTYSEKPNFLVFFIFPSGPSASFANCQLTSVDSCNWRLPLTISAVLFFHLLFWAFHCEKGLQLTCWPLITIGVWHIKLMRST